MNLNVRTEKVKRGKNTTNRSCGKTHKIPLDNFGGAWYNKRKHLKFKKSIRRIMLIMDSGDCTDGKRRGFTISTHRKPCGAENDKCAFFRSVIYRGHEAGDHCFKKALLRSFVGYRYAFLHFRRLLT